MKLLGDYHIGKPNPKTSEFWPKKRYRHHKCGDGIQPAIIEQFLIKISTRT